MAYREISREYLDKLFLKLLSGDRHIFITDGTSGFSFFPSKCKYSRIFRLKEKCSESKIPSEREYKRNCPKLEYLLLKHTSISLIKTSKCFHDETDIHMSKENKILYRDTGHLNREGSMYLFNCAMKKNSSFDSVIHGK